MLFTLLKHKIFESCIDVFFDNAMRNFDIAKKHPNIGDRYSIIYDSYTGDTFYNCEIISIKDLTFYEDLVDKYNDEDGLELNDIAFGIRYTKYTDPYDTVEQFDGYDSDGETCFNHDELDDIIFNN